MKGKVDLNRLAFVANFSRSDEKPTWIDEYIKGPRPFLYRWMDHDSVRILTFEDATNFDTAKFHKCHRKQIIQRVDLEKDTPELVGDDVIANLKV